MSTAPVTEEPVVATAAINAIPSPSFGDIPLECIRASKTNPRKIFNDDELNDLARSIDAQGVAQPILVRPIEVIGDVTYFEIVAGERRFRASGLAGKPTVPAIVRILSDQEAYEIQVLENLQRVDLHPLEEAEGFEVMMAEYKVTADQLAEKTGKSKAYIYASLKLCELGDKARAAFYAGDLNKSTALLVARIPIKSLQEQCVKTMTVGLHGYGGPMSFRAAAEYVESEYMLSLKKASFKPSDGDLLPAAGSCSACPKRTGNQPEVFSGVNADVCTDPVCFKAKVDANVIRVKSIAASNNQTVLSGAAAKRIIPYSYSSLEGGYVRINDTNYDDEKKRTFRQILGKDMPLPTLLECPHTSALIEIIKREDINPLLIEKGVAVSKERSYDNEAAKKRERELAAKAKIEAEYRRQLFEAAHQASLTMDLADADLRLAACQLYSRIGGGTIAQATVLRLRGWTKDTIGYGRSEQLRAAVDALSPAQLNQFIRDCTLCGEIETYSYTPNDAPKNLIEFAERANIDFKKIRDDIDAAAKSKADAKKKASVKKPVATKPVPTTASPAAKSTQATKAAGKTSATRAGTKPAKKVDAVAAAMELRAGPPTDTKTLPLDAGQWPFPKTSDGARPAVDAAK